MQRANARDKERLELERVQMTITQQQMEDEVTQGQRTQEPTTQVTLRRRGQGQDSSNEQKPKESSNRESLGTRLRVLYTTEHVLNVWYTCGVHVGMTSECYVRSETSRD